MEIIIKSGEDGGLLSCCLSQLRLSKALSYGRFYIRCQQECGFLNRHMTFDGPRRSGEGENNLRTRSATSLAASSAMDSSKKVSFRAHGNSSGCDRLSLTSSSEYRLSKSGRLRHSSLRQIRFKASQSLIEIGAKACERDIAAVQTPGRSRDYWHDQSDHLPPIIGD